MPLIDDIEFYGRAVDAGDMTRDDAVRSLAEASNGGLTPVGAATSLDNWQTARAQARKASSDAAASLDKIYGLDDIEP